MTCIAQNWIQFGLAWRTGGLLILGRGGGVATWGSFGGGGTMPAATISGVGAGMAALLTAGDLDLDLANGSLFNLAAFFFALTISSGRVI